jgi:hypothetical protein
MNTAIVIIVFVALLLLTAAFMFWRTKKLLREAKNYERGLKMVPLLIHLPPLSDEAENNNRDARDLADENISKAQILYDIIASTVQKGFKRRFYGQRHIGFEIVAQKGFVYFYTAVPVVLLPVVEQAVLSAYPHCRLEEVAEHNIFNSVGKISGTVGGELALKSSYVYPIATFQDLKRDSMQALLNSLAKLGKEDGVGVQILLRPAFDGWNKAATTEAARLREGKKKTAGSEQFLWWFRQAFLALVKPPQPNDDKSVKEEKPGSNLEQSIADTIEEKTKHSGYEVLIRIITSSNTLQHSQTLLNSVVAVFSLFDAPGKNGFKFLPAKDIESFVTAYILRFFPPEQTKTILNSIELASIFHFPDSSNTPTSQLEREDYKQVDAPRDMFNEGLLLGYNVFRGIKKPIYLSDSDRQRHTYVVGQTGVGKSVFLENMALQDMLEGRGFAFVDPHGDSAERLLGLVPKERTEDVIYFCPAEMDYPMGLNLFEFHTPEQKDFLIQEAISMLYKLYDPQHQGIMGPRYEHIFRNCALLLMADPNGSTFIDIPKLLIDYDFVKQKLPYTKDRMVIDYWTKEFINAQRSNESGEVTSWFVSKFGAFMSNEMMRNIIGQTKSSFNIREIMDSGKILLVNLSKGRVGELNSKLLGMIFVMKFQAAAMSRATMSRESRKDFCLYVDEFQNFSTDSFASILSEARKYGLNLMVANQFTTQLTDEVRDAVFGNIGTMIAFRVGTADAEALEKIFRPVFDVDDLQRLPMANMIARTLVGGMPTQPFSMMSLPMLGNNNKQLAEALKQLSAAKYGRPKAIVEEEIFKRLTTEKPPVRPMTDNLASFNAVPGSPSNLTQQSSFLDEWLAKRRASLGKQPDVSNHPSAPYQKSFQQPGYQPPIVKADAVVNNTQPSSKNISSSSLDNQEVDSIADQLKQHMNPVDLDLTNDNKNVPKPKDDKNDGLLKHNDTIHIDREGNLHHQDQ